MSDLEVVSFRPEPGQYAWTFGGAAPVRRIRTPAVLEVYTEDCFGGRVRSEQDLTSQVCEFPFLNPQTGPFYLEGAEPGDTVAVHFMSIEPARSGEETPAMEPAGNGQSCLADLKAAPGQS
jgi:acetamidase/formamidase